MPPLDLPAMRRTDATRSLKDRPFVLRRGSSDRPVLTATGDDGKAVHVPLHYDALSDTYSAGAQGLFLGNAAKLRNLFHCAVPAKGLQASLESALMRPLTR